MRADRPICVPPLRVNPHFTEMRVVEDSNGQMLNPFNSTDKLAHIVAAAPELYTALSFAEIVIAFMLGKADKLPPTLAEAFRQAHMKATAALAKANPERQTDGK